MKYLVKQDKIYGIYNNNQLFNQLSYQIHWNISYQLYWNLRRNLWNI